MLREDYLIGWIKRYLRWLAEIAGLAQAADYAAAAQRADFALRELLGLGADSVLTLTDGELLARLAVDAPPPVVRDKCLVLAALLERLGQVATARQDPGPAREYWLKALQVVLGASLQGGGALPEYAPSVTALLDQLGNAPLPPRTQAALVLYHEQRGEYARAEDALFRLLDLTDDASAVRAIGRGFYGRIEVLGDDLLAAGGLPRVELAGGLAEWERRCACPQG